MASVSLLSSLRQMASRIGDPEDALHGDIGALTADVMRCVLEAAAESEVERRLGFRLHERTKEGQVRPDYRNGYRRRVAQLSTVSVCIRLPRLRLSGFVPGFLARGERAVRLVDEWVYHAMLSGVSRSELCRLLERLTGFVPSPRLLGRVEAELDAEVKRFKECRLTGRYRYLFVDAAWVKDLVGRSVGRVCVLMAIGVTDGGRKEILGFERARQETVSSWRGFLTRLVDRGLDPGHLWQVISDEHKGLLEAVPEVLGDVRHQLCWAHRARNVRDAVAASDRRQIACDLRRIYRAGSLYEADANLRAFCSRWQDRYPGVTQKLREDARYLLAFFEVPREHWAYVRTTNPIERTFREVRRWRRGCGAFANTKTCDRLFYKVSRLLNERWRERDVWFERRRRADTSPAVPHHVGRPCAQSQLGGLTRAQERTLPKAE